MEEQRKNDHIDLSIKAQKNILDLDRRFNYEPLLSSHPNKHSLLEAHIFGKKLNAPLWVSSMTGGSTRSTLINHNLARVCREFGLGMGLGSCRTLLESNHRLEDFNLRSIIGPDLPFFANIGIAQLEESLRDNSYDKILKILENLDVDGVVIHINPLQEYLQKEGDVIAVPPIETLKKFLTHTNVKVVVKEVGQGMGPESLKELLKLPISGIELAGFGGTNFVEVELRREIEHKSGLFPLATVGHSALEMIEVLNSFSDSNPMDLIISGGIKNFLDSYYLLKKSKNNAVVGQAKNFLVHAHDYEKLKAFVQNEIDGLKMAYSYLTLREQI